MAKFKIGITDGKDSTIVESRVNLKFNRRKKSHFQIKIEIDPKGESMDTILNRFKNLKII